MESSILLIRQMMAEAKLFEAELEAEKYLKLNSAPRADVLPLYLEILKIQNKTIPVELLIEVSVILFNQQPDESFMLLNSISGVDLKKYYRKITELKIKIVEAKGSVEELRKLISEYQIFLYEHNIPMINPDIQKSIEKYFKEDYQLTLQRLALELRLQDMIAAEKSIMDLLQICAEKSSTKGKNEKIYALHLLLKSQKEKGILEVYNNYCQISIDGIKEKKDFKKIIEMVIYADNLKFMALILGLLDQLGLSEAGEVYASEIKKSKEYSFVYFDKYHSELKKYFLRSKVRKPESPVEKEEIDLTLEGKRGGDKRIDQSFDYVFTDQEAEIINILKFQDYKSLELIEIAISFLLSGFFRAAIYALDLSLKNNDSDENLKRVTYIKINCLIQLKEFRHALDYVYQMLPKAEGKDEILSWMYMQADIYSRIGNKKQAEILYQKIISIDEKYRLSRQKLERLNEV